MVEVEEPVHQDGPLDGQTRDQEVESNGSEPVLLQESHEEAEANEDHHVDVLEHCNNGQVIFFWVGVILY